MSSFGPYQQEIEKIKATIVAQPQGTKTSRELLSRVELELRQIFLKTRGSFEEKVFDLIQNLTTKDDVNERISRVG